MAANMSYDAYDDVWEWYSTYTGQDFPEKAAADSIFIYVSPFLLLIGHDRQHTVCDCSKETKS